MKTTLVAAIAAFGIACGSANAGSPADFKQRFDTVLCKGDSEVLWENPDAKAFPPKDKPVTVLISAAEGGWDTAGDFGFHVKRWSRTTAQGFPMGSATWDEEGLWAHWTMAFMSDGRVFFEKFSRQGVEMAVLNCEYAIGAPKP
jgi:hypothetical protein